MLLQNPRYTYCHFFLDYAGELHIISSKYISGKLYNTRPLHNIRIYNQHTMDLKNNLTREKAKENKHLAHP